MKIGSIDILLAEVLSQPHIKFDFRTLRAIACVILTLIVYSKTSAQELANIKLVKDDNPLTLVVENIKSHKQIFITVGQTLRYKTRTDTSFRKDRITGITDSTISFEIKKGKNITIQQKDLMALTIPRIMAGPILFVAGAVVVVLGAFDYSLKLPFQSPSNVAANEAYATSLITIGSVMIATGLTLAIVPRHANLGKKWILKTTSAILPGNIITAILKDGGVIKMKVTKVNHERITGKQSSIIANGQKAEASKTILIKDIVECSRNANEDF